MAIVTSKLTTGSNSHLTTAEEGNGMYTDFVSEGIIGTFTNTSGVAPATGAFACNAQGTPDATIAYSAGVAYVTGTPTSQNSQTFRVKNSASANLTISANSSGSTKYDWIYIQLDATKLNTPNTAGDDVATIVASRSSSASSDDGTPPTYGYPIAVVTVANGFTTITNGNIRDVRGLATITATSNGTSQDWYSTGAVPSTVTALGNRSYTCLFSAVDLTSYLSNGMRLKLTRTVTAPTQCADLESGSSQFFNKPSPAGMAGITSVFTAMGWVKLESYVAMGIISRIDANDGWGLRILATGQVQVDGRDTAGGSDVALSYQSIPLNKWVHVACAFTINSTANTKIYIDGVEVPSLFTNGADTAIGVPAVNLEVGALAGSNFFDGKLAQAAVFSAALSAATIRSYMSQGLSGSETNLVSAYSFNNSIADLNTSNANDLTAQGSALATATDSPFAGGSVGTTEYGIITANTFSTNTTLTVQVPEGNAIPTSGGVSAVSYSTQSTPYGFPSDKGKWEIITLGKTDVTLTNNTNVQNITGMQLTIPTGAWNTISRIPASVVRGSGTGSTIYGGFSTTSNAIDDYEMMNSGRSVDVAAWTSALSGEATKAISITSSTVYYLVVKSTVTPTSLLVEGSQRGAPTIGKVQLAYV